MKTPGEVSFAPNKAKQKAGRLGARKAKERGRQTRARLLAELKRGKQPRRVCDLARVMDLTDSAVCQHLQALVEAGQVARKGVKYCLGGEK